MSNYKFSRYERSKKWNTPLVIPDVDISSLYDDGEFAAAGISGLRDIAFPFTLLKAHQGLWDLVTSCKISMCNVESLISQLKDEGIEINLPENFCPAIEAIPQTFSSDDLDDVEHNQIKNFLDWYISNLDITAESIKDVPCNKAQTLLYEIGQQIIDSTANKDTFIPHVQKEIISKNLYPYNLISQIFQPDPIFIFFDNSDILCNLVEDALETITPCEKKWIILRYQLGLNDEDLLNCLNLPIYPSLLEGVKQSKTLQKALRKLRHPSRSKYLKGYLSANPLKGERPPHHLMCVYNDFVESIIANVQNSALEGKSIRDALLPYYHTEIISELEKTSSHWCNVEPISIDDLYLSRKTYFSLQQANVCTLSDIWTLHGIENPLENIATSSLNKIYGLGSAQIKELFEILSEHQPRKIDSDKVSNLIQSAEQHAIEDNKDSDLICLSIPEDVLLWLLHLKYRKRTDFLSAYSDGTLKEQFFLTAEKTITWDRIEYVANQIASGVYNAAILYTSSFWIDYFHNNPSESIQDIRNAYLYDKRIKCNPKTLEDNIASLFPNRTIEFKILNETRFREMHWIPWPLTLSNKQNVKEILFGINLTNKKTYLLFSFKNAEQEYYELYSLFNGQIEQISAIDQFVLQNIYNSALFNAELFSAPTYGIEKGTYQLFDTTQVLPSLKDNVSEAFSNSQREVAEHYAFELNDGFLKNYYTNYHPKNWREMTLRWMRDENYSHEEYLNMTIDEFNEKYDLSIRTYNCLKRANFLTIRDIISKTHDEMIKVRNLGRLSREEIEYKLSQIGLTLRNKDESIIQEQSIYNDKIFREKYQIQYNKEVQEIALHWINATKDDSNILTYRIGELCSDGFIAYRIESKCFSKGIWTIGDLVSRSRTETELLIGKNYTNELELELTKYGLSFKKNTSTDLQLVENISILKDCGLITIEELDLSVRSFNCVKRANINTVDDLVQMTLSQLLRTKHFRWSCYEEIQSKLAQLGLSMKKPNIEDIRVGRQCLDELAKEPFIQVNTLPLPRRYWGFETISEAEAKLVELEKSLTSDGGSVNIQLSTSQKDGPTNYLQIEELNLSMRTFNCLKRAGINGVEDIIRMTEDELFRDKNLGRRSAEEVIQKLGELGLSLQSDSAE